MRISEVEISSMLTPTSASASQKVAVTPGWASHARPDQRDLTDVVVVQQLSEADLGLERIEAWLPLWARRRGSR